MIRYIAFLRAVNVGGHVVKMDALRALFETLRFTGVETFIASGNVIFETASTDRDTLEKRIEEKLAKALGYTVATFLRTPAEIGAVASMNAFSIDPLAAAPLTLSVGFLKSAPSPAGVAALSALSTDVDEFRVIGRELYWLCRVRTSDSKFTGARFEKIVGSPATFRNVTTVRKLAAKYAS
jgi:uncharacterized protein (DUF1697 family)